MNTIPPTVAIAIATVTTPIPPSGGEGSDRHLVGIGLFHVEEDAPGEFLYRLVTYTVPAGIGEPAIVRWLTRQLPAEATVIGWGLADTILPALIEAADQAPPHEARDFIDVLVEIIDLETVDLADRFGGKPSTFADACDRLSIPSVVIGHEALLGAWGGGRMRDVTRMLAVNAVASWRMWAEGLPVAAEDHRPLAVSALTAWLLDADERDWLWTGGGPRGPIQLKLCDTEGMPFWAEKEGDRRLDALLADRAPVEHGSTH